MSIINFVFATSILRRIIAKKHEVTTCSSAVFLDKHYGGSNEQQKMLPPYLVRWFTLLSLVIFFENDRSVMAAQSEGVRQSHIDIGLLGFVGRIV